MNSDSLLLLISFSGNITRGTIPWRTPPGSAQVRLVPNKYAAESAKFTFLAE